MASARESISAQLATGSKSPLYMCTIICYMDYKTDDYTKHRCPKKVQKLFGATLDDPSVAYWIDFFLLKTFRRAPFTKKNIQDKEEMLVI